MSTARTRKEELQSFHQELELARRMRAESWGKRALLVALTGWGQDQHRRRSRDAGFDRHLIKPADAETLSALLNNR